MSLYKGSTLISGVNTNTIANAHFLFEPIWSDHLINHISYLRADTFSWQDGGVYVTAYNTLVNEYNSGTTETEDSITFRRSSNGYKITTAEYESAVLSKYNSWGISWYYILDTENKRFKLPRTYWGFEGVRTNPGDDIAQSLPNITGEVYTSYGTIGGTLIRGTGNGSLYGSHSSDSVTRYAHSSDASKGDDIININASRSSSTYQDGAPVQETATQMYLYFYVGEYSQTAIEQTAGINTELFNNKADTNLTNVSFANMIDVLYPVGSIYIGTTSTCPLSAIKGTWELVSGGRVLQGADSSHSAGSTIAAGLPNLWGYCDASRNSFVGTTSNGVFSGTGHNSSNWSIGGEGTWQGNYGNGIDFNANNYNSIYGNSSTVQPPAYVVNIWRRTA